jgi:poly-gamma-glutamate capsule biosynthesis protein CapA/YwtB (metallophosphatase superfamily)
MEGDFCLEKGIFFCILPFMFRVLLVTSLFVISIASADVSTSAKTEVSKDSTAQNVPVVSTSLDTANKISGLAPLDGARTDSTLSFVAVGDIMMGLNYPDDQPLLPPEEGALIFKDVKPILENATITVGNLEGVLLDFGGLPKSCSNPKFCYTFRTPERYVKNLVDAGFDLLGVANNHSGDFGDTGRETTQKVLKEAGIGYAGFENSCESFILERDGVKYGFAAFSVNRGTLRVTDFEKAKQVVSELNAKADIVIVNMHIGAEGQKFNHITRQTENFIGENRGNPYLFARTVIDAGADLVFGHGPHVPRAIDLYKGRFIAYSLGNFATSTSVNITGVSGYAPMVKVVTDHEGNFMEGEIISAIQQGPDGARRPLLDSSNACVKEIKRLTEKDIPEAPIIIHNDGKITLKGGGK